MKKAIVKKKNLTEKELRQLFVRGDKTSAARETTVRIERELHNLPRCPEIGPIVRQLIAVTLGMTHQINLPFQVFYTTVDNMVRKMLNHIVMSVITHGMIAERVTIVNGQLEMSDNWDTQDIYDGDFSFFNILDNPYTVIVAPDHVPYMINVNPFNGLMSAYINEMFDLRYMQQNMQSGNAMSTQATTELRTTVDLFKLVMSITDGQEIENEFADAAENNAIHGELSTADPDMPAYRKFDKVQNVLANAVYPKLLKQWGDTGDTFDINAGIVSTEYRKLNVSETLPGVEVKMVPPITTGVMSYHQRSEHVRRLIVSEFSLNSNPTTIINKIRFNAEKMMNKIYTMLMTPQMLGPMFLSDLLEEYYKLRDVRKNRKLQAPVDFADNHDIDDSEFGVVTQFLGAPVSTTLSSTYDPITLSQLITLVKEYYVEMKEIVDAEIGAFNASAERDVKIVWDAIDKNVVFNIDISPEKKTNNNTHDNRA